VAIAFVPVLVFAAATGILFARSERETFREGAQKRTLALLTAVDRELERSSAALEALATSEALDSTDLVTFRSEARRVLESRPEWLNIHLAPPSGRQILNLRLPSGGPFHPVVDSQSFEAVLRTGRPQVGSLFDEPLTKEPVFPVRVPVFRRDELRFVLTALVRTAVIDDLLVPQGLPPDWVGVVLDSRNLIVSRTVGREFVGRPAAESLRAALATEGQGWFRGSTLEGWAVYTPFDRSNVSGWTVAMGIPAESVEGPLRRSLLNLAGFGTTLLMMSVGLAWLLSIRPTRALASLARLARHVGRGGAATVPDGPVARSGVTEIEDLRASVVEAAELVRLRSAERDRVEASLREVEAELRASEQRKDHFLAMLGHELRNPLGVIRTAVELLPDSASGEGVAFEAVPMIERQVAHMARMLDDLLDVSRIAEGRIQASQEPCDLAEIVRRTAEDYRQAFDRSGVKLDLDVSQRPLGVVGDPVRLSQALGNLLQNANKYTDAGGSVTVRVSETADGRAAVVSVADTGVGMEPEILARAFEPFSQADRTLARSRGGLGLGLPLVKGLVELHGGSVVAKSEGSGRGTEVCFEIPLESMPLGTPMSPAPRTPAGDLYHRILIVEDNRQAAEGLQLYLEKLGHEVEVHGTGNGALGAVAEFGPDVVICDIGLPDIDGYEVARRLRRLPIGASLRLVAVTGYGQETDRRRAREAGFDVHLTKPVDLDALRASLGGAPPGA
jgi:signal transduction histidine kinase